MRTEPWRVLAVDSRGRHLQLLSLHCPSWEWVYCLLLLPSHLSKWLLWICLSRSGRKQTNFPSMGNSENSFVCFRGKDHKCCCDVTVLSLDMKSFTGPVRRLGWLGASLMGPYCVALGSSRADQAKDFPSMTHSWLFTEDGA